MADLSHIRSKADFIGTQSSLISISYVRASRFERSLEDVHSTP
jgi:hypothetical protein